MNCLVYKKGSATKPASSALINPCSKEMYEKFANSEDLEDEPVNELQSHESEDRDKEHIIEGNLIYQERIRLGIGKFNEQCPILYAVVNSIR